MKQLLIMRHAKSSWKDHSLSDHDRPLNRRGREDAPRMGRFLQQHHCLPDLVLTSTARRARDTADLFVAGCEQPIPVLSQRSLYHPGLDDYWEALTTHAANQSRIMVVSHNPGSEEWLYQLTGQDERMPTAAIARLQFPSPFDWKNIANTQNAILLEIWRPRDVLFRQDA